MLVNERKYDFIVSMDSHLTDGVIKEQRVIQQKQIKKSTAHVKQKLIIIFAIVVLFLAAFYITKRYAYVTELNYKICSETKKIEKIEKENAEMKVNLEQKINISKVREIAETKLGMQKPVKGQKVCVSVPKHDYVIKPNSTELKDLQSEENTAGVFQGLVSKIMHIIN